MKGKSDAGISVYEHDESRLTLCVRARAHEFVLSLYVQSGVKQAYVLCVG